MVAAEGGAAGSGHYDPAASIATLFTHVSSFFSLARPTSSVLARVDGFRRERIEEAQRLYNRIIKLAQLSCINGMFLLFGTVVLEALAVDSAAVMVTKCVGFLLIDACVITYSACDPAQLHLDRIARSQPRITRLGFLVSAGGFVLITLKGFVLGALVAATSLAALCSKQVMVLTVQVLSFILVFPLVFVVVAPSGWQLVFPHSAVVAVPQVLGFCAVQCYWWVANISSAESGSEEDDPARQAFTFHTVLYLWSFFMGTLVFMKDVECMLQGDDEPVSCAKHMPLAACVAMPPIFLLVVGRRRWFGYLARKFNLDPRRCMKDASFLAQLLDSVCVDVGEEWWQYLEDKDEAFASWHHRHHFRRGKIIAVQQTTFTVAFPASPGRVAQVTSFALAGRNSPMEELIQTGAKQLRCCSWEALSLDLFVSGPGCAVESIVADQLLQASRPVRPGERIDLFLSHCWYDDPIAKYEALSAVAKDAQWAAEAFNVAHMVRLLLRDEFHRKHGRYPTFWFDKACIDQRGLSDGLRVLPLTVMSCDRLLMLFSPCYAQRLWCMWELFTIMAFFRMEQALEKIMPVILDSHQESAYDQLLQFDARRATCFDPNDENRLRKVIAAVGEESFNARIRQLGEVCKQRWPKEHTCTGWAKRPSPSWGFSLVASLASRGSFASRNSTESREAPPSLAGVITKHENESDTAVERRSASITSSALVHSCGALMSHSTGSHSMSVSQAVQPEPAPPPPMSQLQEQEESPNGLHSSRIVVII